MMAFTKSRASESFKGLKSKKGRVAKYGRKKRLGTMPAVPCSIKNLGSGGRSGKAVDREFGLGTYALQASRLQTRCHAHSTC